MNAREVRERLENCRAAADRKGEREKDCQVVSDELRALYLLFDENERPDADVVIAEWVLSGDEKKRFDALVMIADMNISSARSALEILVRRLASDPNPGARFESAKVDRIITALHDGNRP
jgi:hypothetical protein